MPTDGPNDGPHELMPFPDRRMHYQRKTDPPGKLGSVAEAMRPWTPILTLLGAIWGVGVTLAIFFGARITGPADEIRALDARVGRVEERVIADGLQRDRIETWSIALVRSKCLELDPNARALSALPCREVDAEPEPSRSRRMSDSLWRAPRAAPLRARAVPSAPPEPSAAGLSAPVEPGRAFAVPRAAPAPMRAGAGIVRALRQRAVGGSPLPPEESSAILLLVLQPAGILTRGYAILRGDPSP